MNNNELCDKLIASISTSFWGKTRHSWLSRKCFHGLHVQTSHTSVTVSGDETGVLSAWARCPTWCGGWPAVVWTRPDAAVSILSQAKLRPGHQPSVFSYTLWHQVVWPAALTANLVTPSFSLFHSAAVTAASSLCSMLLIRQAPLSESHHTKFCLNYEYRHTRTAS